MSKLFSSAAMIASLIGVAGPALADSPALQIYAQPQFGGPAITLDRPVADLSRFRFNDAAWSAKAFDGAWEVCEHVNFQGRCEIIDRDYANLNRVQLGGLISSARPVVVELDGGHDDGFNGGRGPGHVHGDGFRPSPNFGYKFRAPDALGQRAAFFSRPLTANRVGVDACLFDRGRGCGQPAADAFCNQVGYQKAAYWNEGPRGVITVRLGEGAIRDGRRTIALTDVLCVK